MNRHEVDIPEHLIEGIDPVELGNGHEKIPDALKEIEERQGRREVTILYNHWSRESVSSKKIVRQIMEGLEKAGRNTAICYFSEKDIEDLNPVLKGEFI